jgi:hypothetical protein
MPANPVIGQITVQRQAAPGGASFEVHQRTRIGGVDNVIEARIECAGEALRAWKVRTYHTGQTGAVVPRSDMTEAGRVQGGQVQIDAGTHRYGYTARNGVVTQWTLLDLLIRRADPALSLTVDLLQDLALFKPDQVVRFDGETRLTLQAGTVVTLRTYAQTGEGVLPIHYLIDREGRPQLVTGCMVSWALTGVH